MCVYVCVGVWGGGGGVVGKGGGGGEVGDMRIPGAEEQSKGVVLDVLP